MAHQVCCYFTSGLCLVCSAEVKHHFEPEIIQWADIIYIYKYLRFEHVFFL